MQELFIDQEYNAITE